MVKVFVKKVEKQWRVKLKVKEWMCIVDLPVLIWPQPNPTTKSAIKVSSVSPDLWDTMTPHPSDWASNALEWRKKHCEDTMLIDLNMIKRYDSDMRY